MLFTPEETLLIIPGAAGHLEALAAAPKTGESQKIAVICHPHPLFEGTMHNKVVSTLVRTFRNLGFNTLRFNFRGVGNSTGEYGNVVGEIDDLLAVLNWLKQQYPKKIISLAGFSFGSYVTAKVAEEWPISQLVSIAPPVHKAPFSDLKSIDAPWLVVQGSQDEIVSPQAVFDWIDSCENPPQLIKMAGATHFFHGQLIALREQLELALST